MQVAQTSFLGKTNRAITVAVRNTSCNRGWLQIFTHIMCGTFTVTSFTLILLITLQVFPSRSARDGSRCHVNNCRVTCHEAPYYDDYEDDIVLGVMEAEAHCQNVFISLFDPAFTNESLPQNWLARLRPNVIELSIIGGNLHHIPENVFSGAFARHVKILLLDNVTISSWTPYMFVGLASLEHVFVKNSVILDIQENALSAISQTLEALTVIRSGHWDPMRLTGLMRVGLPKLTTVDFSSNIFGHILGNTSFSRLRVCKSLYLSSSKITYIGPGAFDRLLNIEYLNLNNNFLKTVEPGLFHMITSSNMVRVRLNLIDNLWHCDCTDMDLRRLTQKGVLLVEPICRSPDNLRGKTFTEFNNYCHTQEPRRVVVVDIKPKVIDVDEPETIHSIQCEDSKNSFPTLTPILVSPFHDYQCSLATINITNLISPMVVNVYDTNNFWIKPTLVIRGTNFTMIELGSSGVQGYGLVWYRSSCPNEIFCVNIVPEIIRFYNMNLTNRYIFCPVIMKSGKVDNDQCFAYSSNVAHKGHSVRVSQVLMYLLIAVSCLLFGAVCLYFLIRKYPGLLKGSKRVLFVKHKTVDALVLPPKVPLRSSMLSDGSLVQFNDLRNITEPLRSDFMIGQLARANSVRSSNSCAPSYISALQPTEEQLADWRHKHGNDKVESNYAAISLISSEVTPISILSGNDNLYFSLDESSQSSISIGNSLNRNIEIKSLSLL